MTVSDRLALALFAAVLLSVAAFAVFRRGRTRDPEVARRGRTPLIGYWLRDWLMWVIGPAERALTRANVSPLVFNLAGVAFGMAAGLAYARGVLAFAGWLVMLGGVCDVFDGRLARAHGLQSPRGAFLDSTLDRFAEMFAFVGLACYYADRPWALVATLGALGGSLLVSYARARGEVNRVRSPGGVMQRAERLVVLSIASLLDPVMTEVFGWRPGALVSMLVAGIAILATGTAVYRTAAIARAIARGGETGS